MFFNHLQPAGLNINNAFDINVVWDMFMDMILSV